MQWRHNNSFKNLIIIPTKEILLTGMPEAKTTHLPWKFWSFSAICGFIMSNRKNWVAYLKYRKIFMFRFNYFLCTLRNVLCLVYGKMNVIRSFDYCWNMKKTFHHLAKGEGILSSNWASNSHRIAKSSYWKVAGCALALHKK